MNRLRDLKLKNQLIISTYILFFLLFILKPELMPRVINKIITAFKPFIMGGIIAFLVNLPMKLIEEKVVKPLCKKNENLLKMSRVISLIYTLIIVAILFWIFISYIVPQLADSLLSLTNNIPNYINTLQNEIMTKLNDFHALDNTGFNVQSLIQKSLTQIQNFINMFISNLLNFTIGITNFLLIYF